MVACERKKMEKNLNLNMFLAVALEMLWVLLCHYRHLCQQCPKVASHRPWFGEYEPIQQHQVWCFSQSCFKFFISSVNNKLQTGSQAASSWPGNWESPALMFAASASAEGWRGQEAKLLLSSIPVTLDQPPHSHHFTATSTCTHCHTGFQSLSFPQQKA